MNKKEINLNELIIINEKNTKLLLLTEVFLVLNSIISFVSLIYISASMDNSVLKYVLPVVAIIILAVSLVLSIVIEAKVGYFECRKCHHRYVPTYTQVLLVPHMGWRRRLKCPKCQKRSWNKKTVKMPNHNN